MTAHAMKGDRERFMEAGMDDYISKPFVISDLDTILKKWLKEINQAAFPWIDITI